MRTIISVLISLATGCGGSDNHAAKDAKKPPVPRDPVQDVAVAPPAAKPAAKPAAPAFATIAEAESRALAAAPGHVWNNIVIYDVSAGAVVAGLGMRGGVLGAADASYRPGSVMKVFTVAAALAQGKLTETELFEGKGGALRVDDKTTLNDAAAHGNMTVLDIMATSSNVGAAQIAQKLDLVATQAFWAGLGFDANLPALAQLRRGEFVAYAVGAGTGPNVSAAAIAQAFAALVAPGGAGGAGGTALDASKTALLRKWLHAPITGKDATGAQAAVTGIDVIGKTGTARGALASHGLAHFVGAFPGDAPRYVVVVAVETSTSGYTGGTIAAPAFAHIVEKLAAARQD